MRAFDKTLLNRCASEPNFASGGGGSQSAATAAACATTTACACATDADDDVAWLARSFWTLATVRRLR